MTPSKEPGPRVIALYLGVWVGFVSGVGLILALDGLGSGQVEFACLMCFVVVSLAAFSVWVLRNL